MKRKLRFLSFCLHTYALLMQGSFTGPRIFWSGSSLRTEATGYGLVNNISSLFFIMCARGCVGIMVGHVRAACLCCLIQILMKDFYVLLYYYIC